MTREIRLFNKNKAFRKAVRPRTESDVCPVLVLEASVQWSEDLVNGGSNSDSLKVAKCLAA